MKFKNIFIELNLVEEIGSSAHKAHPFFIRHEKIVGIVPYFEHDLANCRILMSDEVRTELLILETEHEVIARINEALGE